MKIFPLLTHKRKIQAYLYIKLADQQSNVVSFPNIHQHLVYMLDYYYLSSILACKYTNIHLYCCLLYNFHVHKFPFEELTSNPLYVDCNFFPSIHPCMSIWLNEMKIKKKIFFITLIIHRLIRSDSIDACGTILTSEICSDIF